MIFFKLKNCCVSFQLLKTFLDRCHCLEVTLKWVSATVSYSNHGLVASKQAGETMAMGVQLGKWLVLYQST